MPLAGTRRFLPFPGMNFKEKLFGTNRKISCSFEKRKRLLKPLICSKEKVKLIIYPLKM